MPNNQKSSGTAGKTALGLAALAAAAAGAYYFYGSKDAKKHRRQMKGWMVKASGEVMEKMENMKDISKDTYHSAVDQVMDKYSKIKSIPPEELTMLTQDLKSHWNTISKHLKQPTPVRARAKKGGKRKTTKTK